MTVCCTQWTVQYTYLSLFCFLLVPRFEIGNHCLLIKVRCQLKGVCHELFYLYIFMIRTHLVSWLNKITYFRIRFRFCRDIWIFKKLPGVNDTSEYESKNLIVSGWSERDSQVKIFLCENTAIMRKKLNYNKHEMFMFLVSFPPRSQNFRTLWSNIATNLKPN